MSPHHWPKSTVEASLWCNKCGKMTPHRIADGRQQFCLVCYEKKPESAKKVDEIQGKLF